MICINVSIIIPIFNGVNTIIGCLDSILLQNYISYEIICIDDGSTDSTVMCIKKYIKEHENLNIRLLHQKNSGSGSARNRGIEAAQGEYIAFLDADDCFVDSDALEKMYKLCKEKGVSVCGSRGQISNNGAILEADFYKDSNPPFNMVIDYSDYQMDYGYYFFIYNREFLINNHIYFPDYRRYQDPVFFVNAMSKAKKFVMADTTLYRIYASDYFAKFNPNKVIDLLDALIDNMKFALDNGYDLLFERTSDRLNFEYSYTILHNISTEYTANNSKIISLILKANELERLYYRNDEYVMQLLQMMTQYVGIGRKTYQESLIAAIEAEEKIAIYGAGVYGKGFYNYLAKKRLSDKVSCFVTSLSKNDERVEGIPVISIEKYKGSNMRIYVAVHEQLQKEIVKMLKENSIENYELLDGVFLYGESLNNHAIS